jgi:hypothetical protein
MKILIVENATETFLGIKDVLETLDGVEVNPQNEEESINLISDINRHNSNNNKYDEVLTANPGIDLFIVDVYLSRQRTREKNGITFCEYILEKIRKKEYQKDSNFIIISSGYVEPYEIPSGNKIQFVNKMEAREFLYEFLKKMVEAIMDNGR